MCVRLFASLSLACPLLFDLLKVHVDSLEAPGAPETWQEEWAEIEAVVVRTF